MQTTLPLWVSLLALAIGPAVGGAIALLGAFGSPWLKACTDLAQWRRDRRLDAYAELARVTHDLGEATTLRVSAPAQAIEDARRGFDRALYEVRRAASRVILLAPPSVGLVAEELERESTFVPTVLRQSTTLEPKDVERVHGYRERVRAKYEEFISAARGDLGVE